MRPVCFCRGHPANSPRPNSMLEIRLRQIAASADAEVWMSAVTYRNSERNDRGIPEPVAHLEGALDVILRLGHDGSAVHVDLLKDHENQSVSDLAVALDPTTMLLVRE